MASRKLQILFAWICWTRGLAHNTWTADHLEQLKADVLRFLPKDVADKLGALPLKSPPPRQQKIDHVVVLYMENHAADAFFGCMNLPGFDGIKGHSIPKDPTDWSKGQINITCGKALYVCEKGPSYDTFAPKFAKDGNPNHYPYSEQKDNFSAFNGASENGTAVTMFGPEQIPIKAALAKQFGVFNRLFTATPTASSPNHLFTQSATSCGMTSNVLYPDCGGNGTYFPQPTIYDSLRLHNVSFSLFMNSTCGLDGKPCHGEDPHDPEAGSAISSPDVAMIGVARHKDRFMSQQIFYEQAANGTLPALSWILPPLQACDHPCHDIAKGERILKDVYEAIRAGPSWNRTLFFLAYDDAGGFYDHVIPPHEGVPADGSSCIIPGKHPKCGHPFDFRRLGLRATSMLISPWVGKGAVFQEPQHGPFNTSQFELTSLPATVKNLFNLSFFLTNRDAWAGNFEELLLEMPRTDAPLHLPDAPPPATPWSPPPPKSPENGGRVPQHCSSWHGASEVKCKGLNFANLKQKRNIGMLANMMKVPAPHVNNMSSWQADRWLAQNWRKWMSQTIDDIFNVGRIQQFQVSFRMSSFEKPQ